MPWMQRVVGEKINARARNGFLGGLAFGFGRGGTRRVILASLLTECLTHLRQRGISKTCEFRDPERRGSAARRVRDRQTNEPAAPIRCARRVGTKAPRPRQGLRGRQGIGVKITLVLREALERGDFPAGRRENQGTACGPDGRLATNESSQGPVISQNRTSRAHRVIFGISSVRLD